MSVDYLTGSPKVGDVRYVFFACNGNQFSNDTMTGWNQLVNATIATGQVGLWWKPYTGPDVTANIDTGFATDFVAIIASLAGASSTGTPQYVTSNGTGTSLSASSITPTVANGLELSFFSTQIASTAVTCATFTVPSGMTQHAIWKPATGASSGVAGLLAWAPLPSTAATGAETSTASASGTWRNANVVHPPGPVAAPGPAGVFSSFFGGGF